jgi:imidazolonepropionase-like amidohydrolase
MGAEDRLVIRAGRLLGASRTPGAGDVFVACRDGFIDGIGTMSDYAPAQGDRVIEFTGGTILPGLIESHCHLIGENTYPVTESYVVRSTISGVRDARRVLAAGITTVRDLGCRHLGIFALRQAINDGHVVGPRAYVAGRPISGTGIERTWRSHAHDGVDEVRAAVRREWGEGADWIKLSISDGSRLSADGWRDIPLLTLAEIQAAADEARDKGMRIAGHVDGPAGAELAIEAGIDSIEHGVLITLSQLQEMAARGIYFVPTIRIYREQDLAKWAGDLDRLREMHIDTLRMALEAGVVITAGADVKYDAWDPQRSYLAELQSLLSVGLSRMQVFEAATINAAKLLGVGDRLGSLDEGKVADLLVLDGDLGEDFAGLSSVALVVQDGTVVCGPDEFRSDAEPRPLRVHKPFPAAKLPRNGV